jgi:hypothetical protein
MGIATTESTFEKVPVEQLSAVLGPTSLVPIERNQTLSELISGRLDRPVELFPYLMMAVLLLFAAEGWLANRFYRRT